MSSIVLSIFLLSIGASFIQRTTGFGFGIFIMTMLPFLMPSYGEATTLMKEATLPDDVLWSRLADVQNTALLLFANYVDAATQMSESCGGGGSSAMESGWGRKENEDDMAWAHRCAQQAFGMHKRRSRGVHR